MHAKENSSNLQPTSSNLRESSNAAADPGYDDSDDNGYGLDGDGLMMAMMIIFIKHARVNTCIWIEEIHHCTHSYAVQNTIDVSQKKKKNLIVDNILVYEA